VAGATQTVAAAHSCEQWSRSTALREQLSLQCRSVADQAVPPLIAGIRRQQQVTAAIWLIF